MSILSTKTLRRITQRALFALPRPVRVRIDRWLRGQKEFRKLQNADYVVVSLPKSGRTWLRVMLSRYFQQKYQLPENLVLGFSNFRKQDKRVPRILFTHDHVIRYYTGNLDSKKDFYNKKVILLVRDPRDVVVSMYHQWSHRADPQKRALYSELSPDNSVNLFEFAINEHHGIPRNIRFLNSWHNDLGKFDHILVVHYEDLRRSPPETMKQILEFMDEPVSDAEIQDIVSYADFSNMKKREQNQDFKTSSKRLFSQNTDARKTLKTRRGKVGGFIDYMTPEQIVAINHQISLELSPYFGYNNSPENPVDGEPKG